jgi:YidC/Oxa1 family membrane protein insertase
MDRNSIIGIVLIAAIFIVMGIINQPSKEEQIHIQQTHDSIVKANEQQEEQRLLTIQEKNLSGGTADSLTHADKAAKLGDFGKTAFGEEKQYTLENDLLALTVSTKGGRPYTARLKKYRTFDSLPLVLFDGDSTIFGLNFYWQNHSISTNDLYFVSSGDSSKNQLVTDKAKSITMRLMVSENQYIDYIYSLAPGSYQVKMDIKFVGLLGISGSSSNTLDLQWEMLSPAQEKGWKNESQYTSLYYKPYKDDVNYFNSRSTKPQEENIPTQVEWIGYKDQFFASVIMAENSFSNVKMQMLSRTPDTKYIKQFKSIIGVPFKPESTDPIALSFYFGPTKYKLLKKEFGDKRLQDMVSVGKNIIKWINQGVIINIFEWLSKSIFNYGIIILLLTLIIKILLLPLTFRSYVSQAKMRVLKPMVDEITAKIPKDKAMERQQATMALYKKVGVSPLGGCLPMLLQMPILFAMFRFFPTSIELRQQSFLWATDLSTYDSIFEWSATIPLLTKIYGNHISLFTILMTVTTLITMKTSGTSQMSDNQIPGMKSMMYIMPVTFMFVLNGFSAALTYYYFLANVITFGQNYLFKMFINEDELLKKLEARKAKTKKKSKWQQRIEDMQKMQQKQLSAKRK